MTNISEQTLASIVTQNHQVVPILEKHHLDFCCKGKRTLSEACIENGVSIEALINELENVATKENNNRQPFNQMTAEQLISYILIHHHFYVKESMSTILVHLQKVATKHGDKFPYMIKVFQLFTVINEEMTQHMQKEEMILFPRIKEIENAFTESRKLKIAGNYILAPVNTMEHEHDQAGEILYEIRTLTNNYTPPADACTTFKVTLAELKEFEEDLHKHVHLENNLLFPLAEKMLKEISA